MRDATDIPENTAQGRPAASPRTIPDPATEPTMPVKRTAAVLGIGLRSAYSAIERGEIPAIRVGRTIVVPTARFLAKYSDLLPATANQPSTGQAPDAA